MGIVVSNFKHSMHIRRGLLGKVLGIATVYGWQPRGPIYNSHFNPNYCFLPNSLIAFYEYNNKHRKHRFSGFLQGEDLYKERLLIALYPDKHPLDGYLTNDWQVVTHYETKEIVTALEKAVKDILESIILWQIIDDPSSEIIEERIKSIHDELVLLQGFVNFLKESNGFQVR